MLFNLLFEFSKEILGLFFYILTSAFFMFLFSLFSQGLVTLAKSKSWTIHYK